MCKLVIQINVRDAEKALLSWEITKIIKALLIFMYVSEILEIWLEGQTVADTLQIIPYSF